MKLTAREQFIDIVERQYFGSMAAASPERILPLLTEDAVLTGFYGINAPRIVRRHPAAGEESFVGFLGGLLTNFTLTYSQFVHFVDLERQQCACTFRLVITPRDVASTLPERRLRNCNFFRFDDGLIGAIAVYFADPLVDANPWP